MAKPDKFTAESVRLLKKMISKSLFQDFFKFVKIGSLPALCSVVDSELDHGVKLDALECIKIILSSNHMYGAPGRCVSRAEMT